MFPKFVVVRGHLMILSGMVSVAMPNGCELSGAGRPNSFQSTVCLGMKLCKEPASGVRSSELLGGFDSAGYALSEMKSTLKSCLQNIVDKYEYPGNIECFTIALVCAILEQNVCTAWRGLAL